MSMTLRRLRLRSAAAALAVALAGSAPLFAQSTDVDPRQVWMPRAAGPSNDEPLVSPFGVVHERYEPSQAVPDAAPDEERARDEPGPRLARRARARIKAAAAPSPPAESGAVEPSAMIEPPPAEVPSPVVHRTRQAAVEQASPAATPAEVTLREDDVVRLVGIAAAGALLVAIIGFALGRRSGRLRGSSPAVAGPPRLPMTMLPGLAAAKEVDPLAAQAPGKRVKRGHSLARSDEPTGQPRLTTAAKRAVQL